MSNMSKKGKVLVAMSGGIDSSVSAMLLMQQGYDCIGANMRMWKDGGKKSCNDPAEEVADICKKINIPFHQINIREEFKQKIVDFFIDEYKKGRTPNPCVKCNKVIKFEYMLKAAEEMGCDYVATGHYVRIERDENGKARLFKGSDANKDQSYFLYALSQDQLKKALFPLGEYEKTRTREMAKEFGLPELTKKPESQDICFYPEKSNRPFLERNLKEGKDFKEGDIKNEKGEVVGKHKGLPFYTLGQRKGLNIGGGPAMYVQKLDSENNAIIVSDNEDIKMNEIPIREVNFISGEFPSEDKVFEARIRHHGSLHECTVKKTDEGAVVIFESPPNAPMPGQSLVLYKGEELIGGGIMA